MPLTLALAGSLAAQAHAPRTDSGSPLRSSGGTRAFAPPARWRETTSRTSAGTRSSSTPRTATLHSISRETSATPRMVAAVGSPKSRNSTDVPFTLAKTPSRVAIRGSAAMRAGSRTTTHGPPPVVARRANSARSLSTSTTVNRSSSVALWGVPTDRAACNRSSVAPSAHTRTRPPAALRLRRFPLMFSPHSQHVLQSSARSRRRQPISHPP